MRAIAVRCSLLIAAKPRFFVVSAIVPPLLGDSVYYCKRVSINKQLKKLHTKHAKYHLVDTVKKIIVSRPRNGYDKDSTKKGDLRWA